MTFALTLSQVRALKPCADRWAHAKSVLPARKKITAAMVREAGCSFDDLAWLACKVAQTDKAVERRVRHWMADCAAHVLHIYEREYPNSSGPRVAIQAARDFADGKIDTDAMDAAWVAAWVAAWGAASATALDAEEHWQFDRLILWLSEDEPEPFPLPALPVEKAA